MTAPAAPPPSPPPPPRHFGHGALATRLAFEVFDSLKPDAERSSLLNPRAPGADRPGRLGPALVVGVFGEWGAGKSFLLSEVGERLRQLRDPRQAALLQQQDAATGQPAPPLELTVLVEFNAWRYEREPHLLIPLLKVAEQALREEVERAIPASARQREWFNDHVLLFGELIKGLYTHGGREALQLLLAANGAALTLPELKPGANGDAAKQPGLIAQWFKRKKTLADERKLTTPIAALESLYFNFFDYLKGITGRNPAFLKAVRQRLAQQGSGPLVALLHRTEQALRWVGTGETRPESPLRINLVFLVDDLDRCLPEKAIEVLEAVKLFLDVEGCAFVLALDEEVVERGIAHRYQAYTSGAPGQTPITGAEYLEKLIHLPIRLPRPTGAEAQHYLAQHWPDWYAERAAAPAGSAGPAATASSATPTASATSAASAAPAPPPLPEPNALAELVATITPPVPRKLQRVTSLLQINQALAGQLEGQGGTPLTAADQRRWLAMMCALQLFAPALFRFLRVQGGWLLQELVTWRSDLRLNNLDRLRQELRSATRKLNQPWELRDAYARERLPELVQAALLNRSGFSLLTWLEQAQRLLSEARPSDTSLQRLLALAVADVGSGPATLATAPPPTGAAPVATLEPVSSASPAAASSPETTATPVPAPAPVAAPMAPSGEAPDDVPASDANEVPPESPPPEPVTLLPEDADAHWEDASPEPALAAAVASPPDTPTLEELSAEPSALVPQPRPEPARWSPPVVERARLDNEFALWEPLQAGDAGAIERAISREGAALAGRYLPERLVDMLAQAAAYPIHWLNGSLTPEKRALSPADPRVRLLDPLLTQYDVLRLAHGHDRNILRAFQRPSWAGAEKTTSESESAEPTEGLSFDVPWVDDNGGTLRLPLDADDPRQPELVSRRAWTARVVKGNLHTLHDRWAVGADGELGLFLDLTMNGVTQRFRWMEPGNFLMGSPAGTENADELPQHRVVLTRGFWLADSPCTQATWQALMHTNPSRFREGEAARRCPVEQVSWIDVQDFLHKLSDSLPTGWRARLPTEAQWEYAARAGTQSAYWWGEEQDGLRANWNNQREGTTPFDHFPPNPWGLYDVHGNVWEWCADAKRMYLNQEEQDPEVNAPDDTSRVVRGGSWGNTPARARSAYRRDAPPGGRWHSRGFRVALVMSRTTS